MSREYPIWRPRDVTQSASRGVLHFLNWQFLLSSSEKKTQGLKVFAQGTMKLLAPRLKIINNLRKQGCCFVFPAMSVEKRTVQRDLLPTEPSRDDAALSLETCLTPARCAHYSLTHADIRPEVYFCSCSSQTEASLLIFVFYVFFNAFSW